MGVFGVIPNNIEDLKQIWSTLNFSDLYFELKLLRHLKTLIIPKDHFFYGNNYSGEFNKQNIQIDEYIKWHSGIDFGYWKIFVGNNCKISVRGVKNKVTAAHNTFIEDHGNGSIISVKENSCIISYQQYDDLSQFWQWLHGFNERIDKDGIYSIRPEWTRNFPLTVTMGKNSSIVVHTNDKFHTFKVGVDLQENVMYTFHVSKVQWTAVNAQEVPG